MRWTTTPDGSGGSASSAASGSRAGDPGPERVETLAPGGRDRNGLDAFPLPSSPERGPGLRRGRQVDLVEGDQHRLVEETRIVRAKLLADDVVVPCRVPRCAVDDVDEDPRPLDMAQEGMAESGAAARSLDEPGHVGDRRTPFVVLAEVHDPEVRLERGERIVRDLGRRGGDRGEDRRLARVGQPDEPDVGDESELEAEPALGARLTLLGMLRRLVGRGLEVRVAEAAATAAGDHRALADRDQVRHERAGLVVVDRRAGRHVEDQVVAGTTVPSRLRAAATRGRAEVVPMVEIAQGRLPGIDPKVDRSPATAVAAVGTAARNVRLLPEGRGPVTTIAGADPDLHAVEEHQRHSRTAHRPGRRRCLVAVRPRSGPSRQRRTSAGEPTSLPGTLCRTLSVGGPEDRRLVHVPGDSRARISRMRAWQARRPVRVLRATRIVAPDGAGQGAGEHVSERTQGA